MPTTISRTAMPSSAVRTIEEVRQTVKQCGYDVSVIQEPDGFSVTVLFERLTPFKEIYKVKQIVEQLKPIGVLFHYKRVPIDFNN